MVTSSPQTADTRKGTLTASAQAVLADLVDRAGREVEEQLPDMTRRIVSALLDLTSAGPDPRAVMRRVKSGNLLKDNSYAFSHLARDAVLAALRREVERLAPGAVAAPGAAAPVELSLVPLDEIDQQMALGALSRPFDLEYSEQLATLGVRLGLLLGRDLVRAAHNPFRPEVFLAALHEAWREFEPDPEAHGILTPLLRPGLMIDLAPLYVALVEMLKAARHGKDVDTRFAKTDDRAARKAERARRDAALSQHLRHLFDAPPDPALEIPEIPNLPQGSGGWRPSTAAGFSFPAALESSTPAGADPRAGAAAPAQGAGPVAAGGGSAAHGQMPLADLLARLGSGAAPETMAATLSSLFGAPAAGAPAAGVSAAGVPAAGVPAAGAAPALPHGVFYLPRLRESLPQGALSRGDATTLDLLSRIFETVLLDDAIPAETRELIAFLQVPVLKAALRDRSFFFEEAHPARRMLDLLSQTGWEQPVGADDPVLRAMRSSVERIRDQEQPEFGAALAELEAGIAARDSAEQAAMAGRIAQATRQEKQVAAERSARRAVALRLAGEQAPPLVSGFLEQRWTAALALAYAIEETRPGAVDNATRTMDDLIWSVKPKATQEQRKALIGRLPALLTALNKWLDATRWQDSERLQFFAGLADCHASIVRAPIDLSPERQLELAVEAAQQDALRRVAQEQLQERDEEEAAAASDPVAQALAGLERGMRLELHGEGVVRKVRLAWVSPLRTLFIFSGAGRQEAFSLAAERLADLLRAGSMRIMAADGVVGRVLSEAVVPDAPAEGAPGSGPRAGAAMHHA